MPKAIGIALIILILLHVLVGGLGAGWLYMTGRLSSDRVQKTIDLYKPTIAQARARAEKAKELEEQARQTAIEAARLKEAADGPITLTDRLQAEKEADEVARLRLERFQREVADLRARMENDKRLLTRQKEEIEAARQELEQKLQAREEKLASEDFKKAVAMIEALKPKQARDHFVYLMQQDETDVAVDYLAAMNPRKAGAVLREFKEGQQQIAQRAELVRQLRTRGVDLLGQDQSTDRVAGTNP